MAKVPVDLYNDNSLFNLMGASWNTATPPAVQDAAPDSSYWGGFSSGFAGGGAGTIGNIGDLANVFTGYGDSVGQWGQGVAQSNQRTKQYSFSDMIPFASDYYSNGQGLMYDVGQGVGSSAVLLPIGVAMAAAAPEAAVAGTAATISSVLGRAGLSKAAQYMASEAGQGAVKWAGANVIGKLGEPLAEGGGVAKEVLSSGGNIEDAQKAALYTIAANVPASAAEGVLEVAGLKGFTGALAAGGGKVTSALAKQLALNSPTLAAESGMEAYQQLVSDKFTGKNPNENWYDPSTWSPEVIESARAGLGGAVPFFGGGVVQGIRNRNTTNTNDTTNANNITDTTGAADANGVNYTQDTLEGFEAPQVQSFVSPEAVLKGYGDNFNTEMIVSDEELSAAKAQEIQNLTNIIQAVEASPDFQRYQTTPYAFTPENFDSVVQNIPQLQVRQGEASQALADYFNTKYPKNEESTATPITANAVEQEIPGEGTLFSQEELNAAGPKQTALVSADTPGDVNTRAAQLVQYLKDNPEATKLVPQSYQEKLTSGPTEAVVSKVTGMIEPHNALLAAREAHGASKHKELIDSLGLEEKLPEKQVLSVSQAVTDLHDGIMEQINQGNAVTTKDVKDMVNKAVPQRTPHVARKEINNYLNKSIEERISTDNQTAMVDASKSDTSSLSNSTVLKDPKTRQFYVGSNGEGKNLLGRNQTFKTRQEAEAAKANYDKTQNAAARTFEVIDNEDSIDPFHNPGTEMNKIKVTGQVKKINGHDLLFKAVTAADKVDGSTVDATRVYDPLSHSTVYTMDEEGNPTAIARAQSLPDTIRAVKEATSRTYDYAGQYDLSWREFQDIIGSKMKSGDFATKAVVEELSTSVKDLQDRIKQREKTIAGSRKLAATSSESKVKNQALNKAKQEEERLAHDKRQLAKIEEQLNGLSLPEATVDTVESLKEKTKQAVAGSERIMAAAKQAKESLVKARENGEQARVDDLENKLEALMNLLIKNHSITKNLEEKLKNVERQANKEKGLIGGTTPSVDRTTEVLEKENGPVVSKAAQNQLAGDKENNRNSGPRPEQGNGRNNGGGFESTGKRLRFTFGGQAFEVGEASGGKGYIVPSFLNNLEGNKLDEAWDSLKSSLENSGATGVVLKHKKGTEIPIAVFNKPVANTEIIEATVVKEESNNGTVRAGETNNVSQKQSQENNGEHTGTGNRLPDAQVSGGPRVREVFETDGSVRPENAFKDSEVDNVIQTVKDWAKGNNKLLNTVFSYLEKRKTLKIEKLAANKWVKTEYGHYVREMHLIGLNTSSIQYGYNPHTLPHELIHDMQEMIRQGDKGSEQKLVDFTKALVDLYGNEAHAIVLEDTANPTMDELDMIGNKKDYVEYKSVLKTAISGCEYDQRGNSILAIFKSAKDNLTKENYDKLIKEEFSEAMAYISTVPSEAYDHATIYQNIAKMANDTAIETAEGGFKGENKRLTYDHDKIEGMIDHDLVGPPVKGVSEPFLDGIKDKETKGILRNMLQEIGLLDKAKVLPENNEVEKTLELGPDKTVATLVRSDKNNNYYRIDMNSRDFAKNKALREAVNAVAGSVTDKKDNYVEFKQPTVGIMARNFASPHLIGQISRVFKRVFDLGSTSDKVENEVRGKWLKRFDEVKQALQTKEDRQKLAEIRSALDAWGGEVIQPVRLENGKFAILKYGEALDSFADYEKAEEAYAEAKSNYKNAEMINRDDGKYTVVGWDGRTVMNENQANAIVAKETGAALKEMGATDSVVEGYGKVRELYNDIHEAMDTVNKLTGRQSAKYRWAYMPHMFEKWIVYREAPVVDSKGNVVINKKNKKPVTKLIAMESFHSYSDAQSRAMELGKESAGSFLIGKRKSEFGSGMSSKYVSNEVVDEQEVEELKQEMALTEAEFGHFLAPSKRFPKIKKKLMSLFDKADTVDSTDIMTKLGLDHNPALQAEVKDSGIMQFVKLKTKGVSKRELLNYLDHKGGKNRFNERLQEREGKEGWVKDQEYVDQKYIVNGARYVAKQPFIHNATLWYKKVFNKDINEDAKTPMEKYMKAYITRVNGNISEIDESVNDLIESIPFLGKLIGKRTDNAIGDFSKNARQFNTVTKLGLGNISSIVLQLGQVMNINAKLDGNADGINAGKYIGFGKNTRAAMSRAASLTGISKDESKWTEAQKKDMALLRALKLDEDSQNLANEFDEMQGGMLNAKLYGLPVGKALRKSLIAFTYLDKKLRIASAIGSYEKAIKEGKDHTEALKYAESFTHITNFNYAKYDTAAFLEKGGEVGKLLLQFKKYPQKQVEFMRYHLEGSEKKTFWTSYFLMCGLFAVPGADLAKELVKGLFGYDVEKDLKEGIMKWAGKDPVKGYLAKEAMYGLPSIAPNLLGLPGADVHKRIGLSDFLPTNLQSALGPTFGTMANLVKTMQEQPMGLSIAPYIAKDISPALGNYWSAATGEARTQKGDRLKIKYEGAEVPLRALGFIPIREAVERDQYAIDVAHKQERKDDMAKAIKAYMKNPTAKNEAALKDYGITKKQIKDKMKKQDLTMGEQLQKELPKKPKSASQKRLKQELEDVNSFS